MERKPLLAASQRSLLAGLAIGLVVGGIGGALVYAGLDEDAVEDPGVALSPTASRTTSAECGFGTAAELDGSAACSFAFDADDTPARLQSTSLPGGMEGDITLHATCTPQGSCLRHGTDQPVSEERSTRIDWTINEGAEIIIAALVTVETDSLPVREYRFLDFEYDHPAYGPCASESLCSYLVWAKYELVDQP